EGLAAAGFGGIMYAYPVASEPAISRVVALARHGDFFARLDGVDSARLLDAAAREAGVCVNFTMIIDSGLGRFGVLPHQAAHLAHELAKFANLRFCGISTHPGHVYAAAAPTAEYARQEIAAMDAAAENLRRGGFSMEIISSGSTPTFSDAVAAPNIGILHPGNYVFHDAMQIALGAATQQDCALTILATIISHPRPSEFIIDAGAKSMGLDAGAHGNSAISGYGIVVGRPDMSIISLSEEVGKIYTKSPAQIGDKIRIIPNHACTAANLARRLITHSGENIIGEIQIDLR
ncbi:MAG: alanine racemase, partial [Defluviitaleaceae bacterium]|nr:alanine racemase [Defluviitaleaceae bacterium]